MIRRPQGYLPLEVAVSQLRFRFKGSAPVRTGFLFLSQRFQSYPQIEQPFWKFRRRVQRLAIEARGLFVLRTGSAPRSLCKYEEL
jgi:hypothetical protein